MVKACILCSKSYTMADTLTKNIFLMKIALSLFDLLCSEVGRRLVRFVGLSGAGGGDEG